MLLDTILVGYFQRGDFIGGFSPFAVFRSSVFALLCIFRLNEILNSVESLIYLTKGDDGLLQL